MEKQIFICGCGHSGTRVISQILEKAGYYPGRSINKVYDVRELSSSLYEFERHPELIEDKKFLGKVNKIIQSNIKKGKPWALKEGVIIRALPLIHTLYPEAKFIIMVRHGIDQILRWPSWGVGINTKIILDKKELKRPHFEKQMLFWGKVYKNAKNYLDREGVDYMLIGLEDLCKRSMLAINAMLSFIRGQTGYDLNYIGKLSELVKPPSTIGTRFKKQTVRGHLYKPSMISKLKKCDHGMLRFFGYE